MYLEIIALHFTVEDNLKNLLNGVASTKKKKEGFGECIITFAQLQEQKNLQAADFEHSEAAKPRAFKMSFKIYKHVQ